MRYAAPIQGVSTSYLSCLPYIVATHELGHNLGADHIAYPGVTHYSRIPGSYGWYDVPHHFITAMGYYSPCQDVGDFTCVRIPYFSNPKGNYFGLPIGEREGQQREGDQEARSDRGSLRTLTDAPRRDLATEPEAVGRPVAVLVRGAQAS